MHPKKQNKKMDFERRFLDKFRKEDQFPAPQPLGAKPRESFSDQFFKSTIGVGLKLRSKGTLKLSKIRALKFRQRFMLSSTKERSVPSVGKNETNCSSNSEHPDTSRRSSVCIPHSGYGSVDCLPVSVNSDSFLAISTSSSVITLSKPTSMKMSSPSKLGTFKRSDGGSSPYGTLLRERVRKIRPILNDIDFSNPDPQCDLTLNPYNEYCSTLSLPSDTFTTDSLANLYDKTNYSSSYLWSDYSCRVSKDCEEMYQERRKSLSALRTLSSINLFQEPNMRQHANLSRAASTHSPCVDLRDQHICCDKKENGSSILHKESKLPNAFHQELLKKCSNLKSHLKTSLPKDSVSSATSLHGKKPTNALLGSKIEVSSAVPNQPTCHTTHSGGSVSTISWQNILVSSQPKTSIKPQLLPKPFIPPKPEIVVDRSLDKSSLPLERERLRNNKIIPPCPIEINNNCLSVKEFFTTHNSRFSDAKELSENRTSFSNKNKLTEHRTFGSENKSNVWGKNTLQTNLQSKTCSETLQGSKVKNLVASFNNTFNSSENKLNSGTLPFKLLVT